MRAAVEILNRKGQASLVLLCEHASNWMPDSYARLGLDPQELERHIAYDLGAAELTRRLSAALDAPAFLATHSRLLIDLNRPLHAAASIVARSEATDIPGNLGLSAEERAARATRFFHPFHDAVASLLDARQARSQPTRILCIHSFTPNFNGRARPWRAGVLFDRAEAWGRRILERLATDASLLVEANVPYGVGPDDDYALPIHGDARGLEAVLIEVRNDELADAEGVGRWTARLIHALV